MDAITQVHQLGQSLWYDNIERRLLDNGTLGEMIEKGEIRGVTSNPSIFHNAIANSSDYDYALKSMAWAGWSSEQIFYQLAIEDICAAADLFAPLHEITNGADGYVSLEVSPYLAHDTEGTLAEAIRLWELIKRPNLMIKIPATIEGIPAIRKAIAYGINVNVTLIFSLERYALVMDAYLSGLEDRLAQKKPLNDIASVASFFVSRVDSKVDPLLKKISLDGNEHAKTLLGKAAIANTRLAYDLFLRTFGQKRFETLKANGARLQRPLWASTSTKDPAYKETLYVDELIAPDTINTVPPKTLEAFRKHGKANLTLAGKEKEAQSVIDELESFNISMNKVTQELEDEGVKAFSDAFTALLKTVEERRCSAVDELGSLKEVTAARVTQLEKGNVLDRIFKKDSSLWTTDAAGQAEIKKRLGWLDAPQKSKANISEWLAFVEECQTAGFSRALLLGMGGSSLAPEVLSLTAKSSQKTGLRLEVVDSTDPDQVRVAARRSPVEKTLFIVSSKSGGTAEVSALFDYFWNRATRKLGKKANQHFIAITDPGTALEKLATERGFRRVFQADPEVGGRYSALTAFGLIPAALMGIDIVRILMRAQWMADQSAPGIAAGRNPALLLGAVMGESALQGRDKLTIITDPELRPFGSWLEQLVAESSGKEGKGILPVDGEPISPAKSYSQDRLFVYLRQNGRLENSVKKIRKAGHPVLELLIHDVHDLGAEFYRWEIAVSIACMILGVNAFDQPDVQDNKIRTLSRLDAYRQTQTLDEGQPIWQGGNCQVYGMPFPHLEKCETLADVLKKFLKQAKTGDYIGLNAYLPRNPRNISRLQIIRTFIQRLTGNPVTVGFGPRFLHSTGQLHKGGANNGLFIQITTEPSQDLTIPEEGITFGILERAQALGDLEALLARNRRAIRVHLPKGELDNFLKAQ